jgi:hypothetical protein
MNEMQTPAGWRTLSGCFDDKQTWRGVNSPRQVLEIRFLSG